MNENILIGGYMLTRHQLDILYDEMLNDREGYYIRLGEYICHLASKGICGRVELFEDLPVIVFDCPAPENEPSIPLYSNRRASFHINGMGSSL